MWLTFHALVSFPTSLLFALLSDGVTKFPQSDPGGVDVKPCRDWQTMKREGTGGRRTRVGNWLTSWKGVRLAIKCSIVKAAQQAQVELEPECQNAWFWMDLAEYIPASYIRRCMNKWSNGWIQYRPHLYLIDSRYKILAIMEFKGLSSWDTLTWIRIGNGCGSKIWSMVLIRYRIGLYRYTHAYLSNSVLNLHGPYY